MFGYMENKPKRMCKEPGCQRDYWARGYCTTHYTAGKNRGEFGSSICSELACERIAHSKGLCQWHYRQARKRGEHGSSKCEFEGCENFASWGKLCTGHGTQKWKGKELTPIRPPGQWGDWFVNHAGYVERIRIIDGVRETITEHRHVMQETLGRKLIAGENVHHKNGVRNDNRPENLELWSTSQPKGQRVVDKVGWAKEILKLYDPEALT